MKTEGFTEDNIGAYDDYITSLFAPEDDALIETVRSLEQRNIPKMQVSASQGKLLYTFAKMVRAKRILEIGTLGGYSGIHLARALPDDGELVTFEIFPQHTELARRNFERAGVAHKVKALVGVTSDILKQMALDKVEPFDVIFIDANKNHYPEYLADTLPLLKNGGLLLADNTLRDVLSEEDNGIKQYNDLVAKHPQLTSIVIPVLRRFGIDGLTVSFKQAT